MAALMVALLCLAWVIYRASNYSQTFFHESIQFESTREPIVADDHLDYLYVAQKFWSGKTDPTLVSPTPNYAAFLDAYPLRGIGAGTAMLAIRAISPNPAHWRHNYVLFLVGLSVFAEVLFAFGVAIFFRSTLLFSLALVTLDLFQRPIESSASFTTEALSRAFLPIIIGFIFLLFFLNETNRKKCFAVAWLLFLFSALFLCLLKVQWWIGLAVAGIILSAWRAYRIVGLGILLSCLLIYGSVRSINYVNHNGASEFFSTSGYLAAWYSRGPEIWKLGCAQNRFPQEARPFLCDEKIRANYVNWGIAEVIPAAAAAQLGAELSRLNMAVMIQHPLTTARVGFRQFWSMCKYMSYPPDLPRGARLPIRTVLQLLGLCGFFILAWKKSSSALVWSSATALFLVPVALGNLIIPWDFRYIVPIQGLYFSLPILCLGQFLLELYRRNVGQSVRREGISAR